MPGYRRDARSCTKCDVTEVFSVVGDCLVQSSRLLAFPHYRKIPVTYIFARNNTYTLYFYSILLLIYYTYNYYISIISQKLNIERNLLVIQENGFGVMVRPIFTYIKAILE